MARTSTCSARHREDGRRHAARVLNAFASHGYSDGMKAIPTVVMAVVLGVASATMGLPVPVCGDGALDAPEVCDDGNLVDGDGCDSNCTPTSCGNGIVTAGEACDDGNLLPGDCCSPLCVSENLPPDCSGAVASVSELWPPNHKLVPVSILGVIDPDGDPLVVAATAIAQDEPFDAAGSGATCPDAVGIGLDTVSLRAERSGQGDGRFYHVAFQATDRCDAICTGEVTVSVHHDRSPKKVPGDGGPLYDSTLGAPPCQGGACDPTDCVPDPDGVEACDGEPLPPAVMAKLTKARVLLGRGPGGKNERVAAKLLARAARRLDKAARHGVISSDCAAALGDALDGGSTCAVCAGD